MPRQKLPARQTGVERQHSWEAPEFAFIHALVKICKKHGATIETCRGYISFSVKGRTVQGISCVDTVDCHHKNDGPIVASVLEEMADFQEQQTVASQWSQLFAIRDSIDEVLAEYYTNFEVRLSAGSVRHTWHDDMYRCDPPSVNILLSDYEDKITKELCDWRDANPSDPSRRDAEMACLEKALNFIEGVKKKL